LYVSTFQPVFQVIWQRKSIAIKLPISMTSKEVLVYAFIKFLADDANSPETSEEMKESIEGQFQSRMISCLSLRLVECDWNFPELHHVLLKFVYFSG